jgi:hypothetical protein
MKAMPTNSKENRGVLFRNDDKAKDTDRDYSGTLNVEGCEYWVSGWVNVSKKGTKYLSLSIKPKDDDKPEKKPAVIDYDDAIPF